MKWAAFQDRERKIRLRLATIRVLGEGEQELCWSVGGGGIEERVLEVERVRVIGRPELARTRRRRRHQTLGWNPASNSEGAEGFVVREVQGRRAPLNQTPPKTWIIVQISARWLGFSL